MYRRATILGIVTTLGLLVAGCKWTIPTATAVQPNDAVAQGAWRAELEINWCQLPNAADEVVNLVRKRMWNMRKRVEAGELDIYEYVEAAKTSTILLHSTYSQLCSHERALLEPESSTNERYASCIRTAASAKTEAEIVTVLQEFLDRSASPGNEPASATP